MEVCCRRRTHARSRLRADGAPVFSGGKTGLHQADITPPSAIRPPVHWGWGQNSRTAGVSTVLSPGLV